jgi:gamma-glutamyltranspeptidase
VALAAPHASAVEAGRSAVAAGGNALDAALAAAAALTVVYPHQCSIGGDLIAMVRTADGRVRTVMSAGAAAAAFDADTLRASGATRMPTYGPLPVTVPGVVAGWAGIADLGARLGWDARLRPSIAYARDGVAVSPGLARALCDEAARVAADPGLAGVFAGERLVQPALAESLERIAEDWESFYRGPLGERLAAGLKNFGSPLTAGDLAAHRVEIVEPLADKRYGADWYAAPPPSQGATFLAVLGSDDLLRDSLDARRARDALLGDPRTGPIDVAELMNPDKSGIGDARRRDGSEGGPGKPGGDTVAVTAVDADGLAVSLIQSNFHGFGAGLLDPGTGIVLHNRGSMFSLDPGHPGRVVPGSRPPHTLCPAIAVRGDIVLALGCQGGRNQPWILAQVARDALDGDPATAVARPRWIIDGDTLVVEPGVPDADRLARTASERGLTTNAVPELHDNAGHVQMARLRGAALDAAADPRADGRGTVV